MLTCRGTSQDSNDCATDEVRSFAPISLANDLLISGERQLGFGVERRRELNVEILNGQKTFRYAPSLAPLKRRADPLSRHSDAFAEMLESVWKNGHHFEDVKQYLVKRASDTRQDRAQLTPLSLQTSPSTLASSRASSGAKDTTSRSSSSRPA